MSVAKIKSQTWDAQRISEYFLSQDQDLPTGEQTSDPDNRGKVAPALDDYFVRQSERNGTWMGHGAALLGLLGKPMDGTDFTAVLEGNDPSTNRLLLDERQYRVDRVLGYDFTINLDKSISVIYALVDLDTKAKITEALERSVQAAFQEFVSEGVFGTRTGAGGKIKTPTDGIIAAAFTHVTNRNQDPHLHCHLNIMNMALSAQGTWKSVDMAEAYKRQREFALSVDIRMSNELRKLKLELSVKENDFGLAVAGVSDEILEWASSRRREILEGIYDAGISHTADNTGRVALATRANKKTTNLIRLDKEWKAKLAEFGVHSLADIRRQAERDLLAAPPVKRPLLPDSETLLQQITGGRAVAHRRDICREVKKVVLRRVNETKAILTEDDIRALMAEVTKEVFALLDLKPLAQLAEDIGLTPKQNTQGFYCSRRLFQMELEIKAACAQGVGVEHTGLTREQVKKAIIAVEKSNGFRLNREQRAAAIALCHGSWLSVMIGAAGSGKSTSAEAVKVAYENAGKRVLGAAPSAKAAKELELGSKIQSQTTTKLLLAIEEKRLTLNHNDVIVIDEAGMLSTPELYRFYQLARDTGVKLILMGDDRQLEPIPTPSLLSEISNEVSQSVLVDIRRQKNPQLGIGVMKLFSGGRIPEQEKETFVEFYRNKLMAEKGVVAGEAQERAEESSKRSAFDDFKSQGMIVERENNELLVTAVVNDFLENVGKSVKGEWQKVTAHHLANNIMLATTNADVAQLNGIARQALIELGVLDASQSVEIKTKVGGRVANKVFCRGDRVMFRASDFSGQGLFTNGSTGSITDITGQMATVLLDEGQSVSVDLNKYKEVDYAYALTVSKSQGMTVDNTSMLSSGHDGNRAIYVGLSRFRTSGKIFTDDMARLRYQFEDVNSKGNTISYIEGLSGRLKTKVVATINHYLEDKSVEMSSVREQVSRIGEGINEIRLKPVEVLSQSELAEKIEQAAKRHFAAGSLLLKNIHHASLMMLAKREGFVQKTTLNRTVVMTREKVIEGVKKIDRLEATYSDSRGWYFELLPAGNEEARVRGGNVEFIRYEKSCEAGDAAVYISQTQRAHMANLDQGLRNNHLGPEF